MQAWEFALVQAVIVASALSFFGYKTWRHHQRFERLRAEMVALETKRAELLAKVERIKADDRRSGKARTRSNPATAAS
ncbi:hypothetical protein GCM10011385_24810 [Nitratireductor aestuarii]|jgi:hypothetical protein|uniref:Uncharacterized protein n=1 Tax=Nitratireductor aestuarii TaxID=1735103 RepID=A0A916RVT8_9HYPH|nr:hypothetical protein [Nitratireductor aestuarii]GGA70043.1 hypothetical protein GCM10011385_24810 [Nitratireductor aestuarii]